MHFLPEHCRIIALLLETAKVDPPTVIVKAAAPSQYPRLEMILSHLTALAAVVGGLFAVFKYLHEIKKARQDQEESRNRAALTAAIEARKPFLARQQDVYFDLVNTTAILGNNYANTARWKKAYKRFWELYWGDIPVVADVDVGAKVDAFADTLDHIEKIDGIAVRNASMELGRACRESLAKAWKTELPLPKRTNNDQGAPTYNQLSQPGSATDHGSEL